MFVNTDELFQFPRLASQKVSFIGGITIEESANLTQVMMTKMIVALLNVALHISINQLVVQVLMNFSSVTALYQIMLCQQEKLPYFTIDFRLRF